MRTFVIDRGGTVITWNRDTEDLDGQSKEDRLGIRNYEYFIHFIGDHEKALASGRQGYIEKPINPEYFVTQIGQYISQPQREEK